MTKLSYVAWVPIIVGAAIAIPFDDILQSAGAAVWLLGIGMQILVGSILLGRKVGWSTPSIFPKARRLTPWRKA